MSFSVKAVSFSGQTNSSNKNMSCQPIKDDFGFYKINFGNAQPQAANKQGDFVSLSSKNSTTKPEQGLSFGEKFVIAAQKIQEKLGTNISAEKAGKELGKEIYGVQVN